MIRLLDDCDARQDKVDAGKKLLAVVMLAQFSRYLMHEGVFRRLEFCPPRAPSAAEAVGGGALFAPAPGKGIFAHREACGVLHTYVQLRRPAEWFAGVDFSDAAALSARIAAEFDGWAPALIALMNDGETPPVLRTINALPNSHRWNRVPGLLGDAAHLAPPADEGACIGN